MQFDHAPTQDEIRDALSGTPTPNGREEFPVSNYASYTMALKRYDKNQGMDIWNVYMRVDGRIMQARDVHAAHGCSMHERIELISGSAIDNGISDYLVVKIEIDSSLDGIAVDYATAVITGKAKGVDVTNPVENAVTSARGRALAALGYGIIPGGVASAEEVEDAIKRQGTPKAASSSISSEDTRPEEASTPTRLEVDEKPKKLGPIDMILAEAQKHWPDLDNNALYDEVWKVVRRMVEDGKVAITGDIGDYTMKTLPPKQLLPIIAELRAMNNATE